MQNKKIGIVRKILPWGKGIKFLEIMIENVVRKGILYEELVGTVDIGDTLLINTTAVDLGLGTGGFDFVICNLSNPNVSKDADRNKGHIVKLRYTPFQFTVLSSEEKNGKYHMEFQTKDNINGMPVILCSLHSQLMPCVITAKMLNNNLKVGYIMQEGGCLPVGFSKMVTKLKDNKLIDIVITPGNTYGGDLETVNYYTALLTASLEGCSLAIMAPGPGTVGTGTLFGFTSIEVGENINRVNILKGIPITIPRISFSDLRVRHRGISHHTLTILKKIALTPTIVPIPILDREKEMDYIKNQIKELGIDLKHKIMYIDVRGAMTVLKEKNIDYIEEFNTMGRNIDDDYWSFLSSVAGSIYCNSLLV